MTTVTLENNRLSVAGHAGYGNVGYDIVSEREKPNNNITTKNSQVLLDLRVLYFVSNLICSEGFNRA
mgnify:CR=1 FL=1